MSPSTFLKSYRSDSWNASEEETRGTATADHTLPFVCLSPYIYITCFGICLLLLFKSTHFFFFFLTEMYFKRKLYNPTVNGKLVPLAINRRALQKIHTMETK